MKILVTGATGFLGRVLCRLLENEGQEVIKLNSKNCDLRDDKSLTQFKDERFDQIFHLAVYTQAGDWCLYHPGEQWIVNQKINTNVLSWWQECQPQAKLIAIGTSCAYDPNLELKEENYLKGEPIESLYTYAFTKRMLYIGLLALNKQFGLKYLYAVPNTLYGPGYHIDNRQMHFIFDLIRKIIKGKLFGDEVVLWGDGYQKRELVFVEDFAKTLIKLAQEVDADIFNIGYGKEYSIREFAELICRKVGYDFNKIKFDTNRYVGSRSKCLNITKLKQRLPNWEATSLEVGLNKTIEWFLLNQDKIFNQ